MSSLADLITLRLHNAFPDAHIDLRDDSASHKGHQHNTTGGGHFTLKITSDQFTDKSLLARHQLIYTTLGDLIPTQLHALKIIAKTTTELL